MSVSDLDELTMDAMAELLNMGMGKAASELSGLVDSQEVEITVPTVHMVPKEKAGQWLLKEADGERHGYCQRFIGDFEGNYLVAFSDASVASLKAVLDTSRLRADRQDDGSDSALVSEVGYIMTSTTFGAVSALLSSAVLSDRLDGEYVKGTSEALVARALDGCETDAVIACEIEFSLTEHPVYGQLLMVLTRPDRFIELVRAYVESI